MSGVGDASEIMEVGSEIIFGIPQTDDYIRAIFDAQGADPAATARS